MLASLSDIECGLVQAVAYGDLFDYPLTAEQAHRYMVGVRVPRATVDSVLEGGLLPRRRVDGRNYYFLPGRESTVSTRMRREKVSAEMWPRAQQYALTIAALPFVRMVAVSGALAMDNMDPGTDIDYMVVTEGGRLWLCRAMVIALVRLAGRQGDVAHGSNGRAGSLPRDAPSERMGRRFPPERRGHTAR
jgi:hypothetical protein